jgi:UDP-glucose 4-epimerase
MTHRHKGAVPSWAKRLEIVQGDMRDEGSLSSAVDGIDAILHLAALNEIECQQDPDLALEVNGNGTQRLLHAAQSHGVSRFIYMSTFHVYGPGAAQPITENSPTRPIHPYAITHRLAEDFVNSHRHNQKMETLILRLSNGYGYPADPGVSRWSLVFNDLCRQAVEREEIKLRSGGTQQRDFVSITDVSRGVYHFLGLPEGGWGEGLLNFGGECSMSIIEVARLVAAEYLRHSGKESPITTGQDDPAQTSEPVVFSIEKLKATGFCLTGEMAEEVRQTFRICERSSLEGTGEE